MEAKNAFKIFGMFDKVDDIIYEPLHLLCDALRQPLKQIDINNEKRLAEHKQDLDIKLKQFEVDLELDRKEREMKLSLDEQKAEEEINQMILDSDLLRKEKMVQLEVKYRKEMAEAATQLANVIANIAVDTRGRIISLYNEKEKEYLDLQNKYKKEMYDSIKNLKEIFPDGTGDDIIREEVTNQLMIITERSSAFSKLMHEDMKNVFGIIDNGIREIGGVATKYFQPSNPNSPSLTQNVIGKIEEK
jgi:sll1241 protein